MKSKVISMLVLFEAESLNYGEGLGNMSQLKKLTRYNGESFAYFSRQGLRYNIATQMGIDNSSLVNFKEVIQYDSKETIATSVEQDLFGYMITDKKRINRTACVRLSNAISLEPYNSDVDFLTNKSFLERFNRQSNKAKNGGNMAETEIHKSYYVYNVVIELDRIGIDINTNVEISKEEKINRVASLLDAIMFLSRDIKGRTESLIPKFVVGGSYTRKNSFFSNSLKCYKNNLKFEGVKDILELSEELANNTKVALMSGVFANEDNIRKELNPISIREMFDALKEEVQDYYA